MSISITDTARENLERIMGESGLQNPALRVVFQGIG